MLDPPAFRIYENLCILLVNLQTIDLFTCTVFTWPYAIYGKPYNMQYLPTYCLSTCIEHEAEEGGGRI